MTSDGSSLVNTSFWDDSVTNATLDKLVFPPVLQMTGATSSKGCNMLNKTCFALSLETFIDLHCVISFCHQCIYSYKFYYGNISLLHTYLTGVFNALFSFSWTALSNRSPFFILHVFWTYLKQYLILCCHVAACVNYDYYFSMNQSSAEKKLHKNDPLILWPHALVMSS